MTEAMDPMIKSPKVEVSKLKKHFTQIPKSLVACQQNLKIVRKICSELMRLMIEESANAIPTSDYQKKQIGSPQKVLVHMHL